MRHWKVVLVLVALSGVIAVGAWLIARNDSQISERQVALRLADEGKYSEAIPRLKTLLSQDPNDLAVLERLVDSIDKTDYVPSDILPYLDRWCELSPDDHRPFLKRLLIRVTEGKNAEALADAVVVLQLKSDFHEIRVLAARLLYDLRRIDDCIKVCQVIAESNNRFRQESLYLMAICHIDQGRPAEAARILDEILALAPGFDPARMLRGEVYLNEGKYEMAADYLSASAKSITLDVRQRSLASLARALAALGRTEDARKISERLNILQQALFAKATASTQRSGDWPTLIDAGRQLFRAELYTEAIKLLEDAADRLGANQQAFAILADCYERQGMKHKATQYRKRLQP